VDALLQYAAPSHLLCLLSDYSFSTTTPSAVSFGPLLVTVVRAGRAMTPPHKKT
jgi:hypothetical protein